MLVVRWRIDGDLVHGSKISGQAHGFHVPVFVVKDDMSIVVLARGMRVDMPLQATA